jgi:hypothetical protein
MILFLLESVLEWCKFKTPILQRFASHRDHQEVREWTLKVLSANASRDLLA